ncbi:major facilitator superfamily transporter [Amniculicola lignicola CBS 123094]|uniref:Major facilitator superfamily transporter n=1 Tax=Amniculicola lignicola CBS 123094 TaxID=1392246 RepID=A0A6A5WHS5_9PLEO|nr:major facilitator superfamily transporter [Amniculicola lignicola CBS 123094]
MSRDNTVPTTTTATPSDIENGVIDVEEKNTVNPGSEESESEEAEVASIHSIGNQTNVLPRSGLLIAIPALSVALFVSFIDTTSVSTSIPAISNDLNTGTTTSWIGSSFLVASTAFQLINGRLSDIFGRKNCLLLCLALLGIGDIGCGCAQSKEMLYVFRALAGIGGGGINSLAMIIVSDITTLESRGKYQGIFGAVIALANGTGPFVGGALVDSVSWRWVFWIVPMLALPAAVLIFFFLPLKYEKGNYGEKVRKIDYGGILLNIAAVLLILIPLSGGGVQYAWDSPLVIAMLTVGACTTIAFLLYEWKVAPVPIMPVHLVRYPYCWSLYLQNFFTGLCFFGNFFYLPIYFQSVRGFNALIAGAFLLAVILPTSVSSICAGQLMSRTGRYFWIVLMGFVVWTLGTGLKCAFDSNTSIWHIILVLIVEGLGIGMTLQPTLVAILSNSSNSDRAVATGLRNFIRTIGGAFGLIISGAILSNTLDRDLGHLPWMSSTLLKNLTSSTYSLDKGGLTQEQRQMVLNSYMSGITYIFIMYAASSGFNLLLCVRIGNTSLKAKKPVVEKEDDAVVEGVAPGSVDVERKRVSSKQGHDGEPPFPATDK